MSRRGRRASVRGEAALERARGQGTSREVFREKLDRLGDTPYRLGTLSFDLADEVFVPASSINQARRALVDALAETPVLRRTDSVSALRGALPSEPPARGLFVLCRNLEQARAALEAGVTGVYLDFLELTGTGAAFRALRAEFPASLLGVAPPRIRKPGEEKIDRYLSELRPDQILVRGLGALRSVRELAHGIVAIGDFSLNVASQLSARAVLERGLAAFTPAFDLDAAQLEALVKGEVGRFAEVVVHHPMPLFHMEHCVYAALLSTGSDYKSCGRPCEQHEIELRDRSGRSHPVVADVGCRNTVFHGASQSAAALVPALQAAFVQRYRLELLRESAADTRTVVATYQRLLRGELSGRDVWNRLRSEKGYGVVRGSLRVVP